MLTTKHQNGFTLIEVLVVLALIAVCFSVIIPQVQSISDSIEMKLLAQQIRSDLYWLQNQAIASGKQMNIEFPVEKNFYYLNQGYLLLKKKNFSKKLLISTDDNYKRIVTISNKGSLSGGEVYIKNKTGKVIKLIIQVVSGRIRIVSV